MNSLVITAAEAEKGRVAVNPDGTLSYTVPSEFTAADTITFTAAGRVSIHPAETDQAPVPGPDEATAAAGEEVALDVLGNDSDPEGATLTIIGAIADQGSVTVNPDGTLAYAAPAGFSGTATITYTVSDPAGNTSEGTVTVPVETLSVSEGELDGEFVVTAVPGRLTVEVTAPEDYAGAYVLETTDLEAAPVNLVPPRITGSAADATLSVQSGLWAFEADEAHSFAWQWQRDGSPIAGATGATYEVDAAADAEKTLSVIESIGGITAESAELRIPSQPSPPAPEAGWTPSSLPGLALWLDASDAETVTLSGTEVIGLADKSGNGRHVEKPADGTGPTLAADLDGKPVLRFEGRGHLQSIGAPLPDLPGMPGITFIAVTQAHLSSAFAKCFAIRNGAAGQGEHISVQTGYAMMYFGNGNRYWTRAAAGPAVEMARYPADGTHADAEWWRNGTKLDPTSTARSGNSVSLPGDAFVQIGSSGDRTAEQAEILLVVGPLAADDRQKAEAYLAHKWGLAAHLPDDHPYKASPPD